MPVAMRRRSWEDHVTHRTVLWHSFDDLDALCCRGLTHDGCRSISDVTKSGRRARCASLPECRCEPRAERRSLAPVGPISTDDYLPVTGDSIAAEGSTETLVFEHDDDSVGGSNDSSSADSSLIGPSETKASNEYTNPTRASEDAVDLGHNGCILEDGSEKSDQTASSKQEGWSTPTNGSDKLSHEHTPLPLVSVDSRLEKTTPYLDPVACDSPDATATGTLGNAPNDDVTTREATSHSDESLQLDSDLSPSEDKTSGKMDMDESTNTASQSKAIGEKPVSEAIHVPECNGATSNEFTSSENPNPDGIVGETLQFDKSALGEDAELHIPCDERVGFQSSHEKPAESAGESANATSNVDIMCQDSLSGSSPSEAGEYRMEAKVNVRTEEDGIVKLRKRKGSKEERGRSYLDSMVLLIMKLDQLDQDIENALSASSSISSTPISKRRNVHEKHPDSLNGGEAFHPVHQQQINSHMIFSALTSPGPTTLPEEKPRTGMMPSISENDRAESVSS
ncbi:hypothetical protein GJAV_G00165180 [Gymnothorax javanicus]|nr:hypothetical protein GJAV_G00165180 [Gymnothorax javanicus]